MDIIYKYNTCSQYCPEHEYNDLCNEFRKLLSGKINEKYNVTNEETIDLIQIKNTYNNLVKSFNSLMDIIINEYRFMDNRITQREYFEEIKLDDTIVYLNDISIPLIGQLLDIVEKNIMIVTKQINKLYIAINMYKLY